MDTLARILADHAASGAAVSAEAAERFRAYGLPRPREEAWRYANLHALDRVPSFGPAPAAGGGGVAALPPPIPGFTRLLLVNGRRSAPLPAACAATAASASADSGGADGRFELLNRMFAPESQSLRLAGEARIEIVSLAQPGAVAGAVYPRVSVDVAPGARAQLIERHLGSAGARGLVCPSVGVTLGDAARLDHYRLQQCADDTLLLDTLSVEAGADAEYRVRTASCGAATARSTALVRLAGAGATLGWHALAVAHRNQVSDLLLNVEHAAPATRTEQLYRAITTDGGHAACSAEMRVAASARGARVAQSLRGLLDGERGEIDLKPRLEIHTDEVQAAHGATTGRLDETLLFYLLSRGLEPDTARALLRWAFLGDVLRAWEIPGLRSAAEHAAAGQLGAVVPEMGA